MIWPHCLFQCDMSPYIYCRYPVGDQGIVTWLWPVGPSYGWFCDCIAHPSWFSSVTDRWCRLLGQWTFVILGCSWASTTHLGGALPWFDIYVPVVWIRCTHCHVGGPFGSVRWFIFSPRCPGCLVTVAPVARLVDLTARCPRSTYVGHFWLRGAIYSSWHTVQFFAYHGSVLYTPVTVLVRLHILPLPFYVGGHDLHSAFTFTHTWVYGCSLHTPHYTYSHHTCTPTNGNQRIEIWQTIT